MAKGSGGTRSFNQHSVQQIASTTISTILSDIHKQGFSRSEPFKIGNVENRMKEYAELNGIELGSSDVYMSSSQIAHAMRDTKAADGKTISEQDLINFPQKRYGMQLFYEREQNGFVYFDGANKYVVKPNYSIKLPDGRTKVVNFITASLSDGTEFRMHKYEEIKKK